MSVHLIVSQQPEKACVFLKVSDELEGVSFRESLSLQMTMLFHKWYFLPVFISREFS